MQTGVQTVDETVDEEAEETEEEEEVPDGEETAGEDEEDAGPAVVARHIICSRCGQRGHFSYECLAVLPAQELPLGRLLGPLCQTQPSGAAKLLRKAVGRHLRELRQDEIARRAGLSRMVRNQTEQLESLQRRIAASAVAVAMGDEQLVRYVTDAVGLDAMVQE